MNSDTETRNWNNIDRYYLTLRSHIFKELECPHHRQAARDAVDALCADLDFDTVVELGCATAPVLTRMRELGKTTQGVTLLDEPNNHPVLREDMHFSSLPRNSFDMVVVRHALEHSPMPLYLLMEMHRIARKYALVILPTPTARMITTWTDHYSVFDKVMWEKLFNVSGWKVKRFKQAAYFEYEPKKWDEEYRFVLEK